MEVAPPPAAEYGGLPRRKTFFAVLILYAPTIFSKRKRKFFCSAPRSHAGGGISLRLAGKKESFPGCLL